MRVLVTGGAGFVGTNLCKRLVKRGYQVTSIDNYSTGLESNHIPGVEYLYNDLRELKEFPEVDIVFHMAAIARIQPSFKNPVEYFTTNANATLNLVDWCVNNEVPIIYAGSSSKHSGRFKNPYTFSKDIGEDIIELYRQHFGLPASITRFYNVYGPHQLTEGGYTTLIGRWLNNIEKGIQCEIYGDGEQRRDFTHVDDIVDALIRIMDKEYYDYDFELGRGKNISVNEVAEMMGIEPVYKEGKPGEARHTLSDNIDAKVMLGWEPERELQTYINEILR